MHPVQALQMRYVPKQSLSYLVKAASVAASANKKNKSILLETFFRSHLKHIFIENSMHQS